MTFPAFPHCPDPDTYGGLTKREYAAIHIAAAIASRRIVANDRFTQEAVAQEAVALADAVLREAGKA